MKQEIRKILDEMKELKRCREQGIEGYCNERYGEFDSKYEDIDTLFGHESTLSKAIIYCLTERIEKLEGKRKICKEIKNTKSKECNCDIENSYEFDGVGCCNKCHKPIGYDIEHKEDKKEIDWEQFEKDFYEAITKNHLISSTEIFNWFKQHLS